MPVWIYQVAFFFTHDLVALVRVRAAAMMFVTLAAGLWIRRLLRLPIVWVWLIAFSPYMLLYARMLWDNSFNIPLSALLVATTLQLRVRKSLWPVPLAILLAGAMLLVHPMSLALVAACGIFIGLGLPEAFRAAAPRQRQLISSLCVLVLVAGWLFTGPYRSQLHGSTSVARLVPILPNGWWFALFSPRLLSAAWLDYFFPPGYLENAPQYPVIRAARTISLAIFPLAWAGIVITLMRLLRADRLTRAGQLGLLILIAQLLLNGLTRTFGHPHYYNATWLAPALLAALPIAWLSRRAWGKVLVWMLPLALLVSSIAVAIRIHQTGGTPGLAGGAAVSRYGPTLSNQIELADAIRPFDARSHLAVRPEDALLPFAVHAICTIGEREKSGTKPIRLLHFVPLHADRPFDGRMAVVIEPMSVRQ